MLEGLKQKVALWIVSQALKSKEVTTMLDKIRTTLQGKKTYLVAFGALVTIGVAWGTGVMSTTEAVKGIFEAITAMTVRAAVASSAPQ